MCKFIYITGFFLCWEKFHMRVAQKIRTFVSSYYTLFSETVILRDFTRNTQEHDSKKWLLYRDLLLWICCYPVTQYLCHYSIFLWMLLILSIQFTWLIIKENKTNNHNIEYLFIVSGEMKLCVLINHESTYKLCI